MLSVLRVSHGIMALLFALSALVQFNDPSPAPWIALYLTAAVSCGLAFGRKVRPGMILAGIVLLVCIVSEIPYVQHQAWQTPFLDLADQWHMTGENIVDGREFYALIWIGGWMALVIYSLRREAFASKSLL